MAPYSAPPVESSRYPILDRRPSSFMQSLGCSCLRHAVLADAHQNAALRCRTFIMREVESSVGISASASTATAVQVAFAGMPSVAAITRDPALCCDQQPSTGLGPATGPRPLACKQVSQSDYRASPNVAAWACRRVYTMRECCLHALLYAAQRRGVLQLNSMPTHTM